MNSSSVDRIGRPTYSVLFGQSAKIPTIYPEKTASRLPSISHSPVLYLQFRGVLCKLRPLELNFTLSEKSTAAIPCRPGEGWSPITATGGEWEGEGLPKYHSVSELSCSKHAYCWGSNSAGHIYLLCHMIISRRCPLMHIRPLDQLAKSPGYKTKEMYTPKEL